MPSIPTPWFVQSVIHFIDVYPRLGRAEGYTEENQIQLIPEGQPGGGEHGHTDTHTHTNGHTDPASGGRAHSLM